MPVSCARYDNARTGRAQSFVSQLSQRLAVVSTGCDPLDVGPIKSNIGQFPIAQLGQFSDIALIVTERLDSADK